ncbi:AzlC family ABC transporter permease [Actinopolyspora mortivallis]|uniref:AzlC family ABC transporter permease n=1 Tax=Actinopolyspora mortivallis TaxID=33906 RepID=UPI0012EEAF01|nr:AzlC family ABC transporter permease [Actinopolyspora mortivallis]
MRRTLGTLRRDSPLIIPVASMALALAVVGASLGAIAVTKGVPLWLVTLMAALVFAGGSELLAVGMATSGAAPFAVVLGGLLLNARHLPYGLALGGMLADSGPVGRLFGSHLLVDEAVAFALAESDPHRRRRAYWAAGLTLYGVWAPSVFLGGLLGDGIGDPRALGLDAALPAGLLALVLPALRDRPTLRAVALGSTVAVVLTPVLEEGLPVLCGLFGMVAALPVATGHSDERSEAGV